MLIDSGVSGAIEGANSFAPSEAAAIQSGSSASSEQERFQMALDESSVNPRSGVRVRAAGDPISGPGTGGGTTGEDSEFETKFLTVILTKGILMGQSIIQKNLAIGQATAAWAKARSSGNEDAKDEAFTRLKKAMTKPIY